MFWHFFVRTLPINCNRSSKLNELLQAEHYLCRNCCDLHSTDFTQWPHKCASVISVVALSCMDRPSNLVQSNRSKHDFAVRKKETFNDFIDDREALQEVPLGSLWKRCQQLLELCIWREISSMKLSSMLTPKESSAFANSLVGSLFQVSHCAQGFLPMLCYLVLPTHSR